MKTAILFLVDEYADWEGAYLSSILNTSKEWEVKTASTQKKVTSIGGFKTTVDYLIDELPEKIDTFILIGGNNWQISNETLLEKVTTFLNSDLVVGAICGAVDYLAKNGLLTPYKHTGNALFFWQEYEKYTTPENFQEVQCVSDKNLVTANGTAAIDFTEALLEKLDFETEKIRHREIGLQRMGYYAYVEKYGNPFH